MSSLLLVSAGLVVGVAMVVLALRSFRHFVFVALLVRPLLDVAKSASGTGLLQPTSLLSLAFLTAACLWLSAQREALGPAPRTPLWWALTAYAAAAALSTAFSLHVLTSVVELLKLVSWYVMYLVLRRLVRVEREVWQVVGVLALSCALPLLIGYLELVTPGAGAFTEFKDGIVRLRSTFDQSNNFARFLMFMVISTVVVAKQLPGPRRGLLLALGMPLLALPLYATYTRAAWIGVAVGVVAVLVVHGNRAMLAVGAAAAVLALAVPSVTGRLQEAARPQVSSQITNDSVGWRLSYWQDLLSLAQGHELLGIGPNSTPLETVEAKEPHNEYLRSYVEGGVLGLVSFLALMGVLALTSVRAIRASVGSGTRHLVGVWGFSVTAAVAVAGIASNVFDSISFMWLFAVVLGVLDSRYLSSQTPAAETNDLVVSQRVQE